MNPNLSESTHNVYLNDAKRKKNKFNSWMACYIALVILLVMNGMNNAVVNILTLVFFVAIMILAPLDYAVALFSIVLVYLTYSNISFSLGGTEIALSTVTSLYFVVLFCRLIFRSRIIINNYLYFILILYCSVNVLVNVKLTQFIVFLAEMIFVMYLVTQINHDNTNLIDILITFMIFAIVGECIYGILFNQNADGYSWRALQFSGIRDPNDLALHCGFLFILLNFVKNSYKNIKFKKIVILILSLIVLTTLSFTGILMIIGLLLLYFLSEKRYFLLSMLGISLICIVLAFNYNNILFWMVDSNVTFIKGIGERFIYMLNQYKNHNYVRLTSNRSYLWSQYFAYFQNLNVVKQIFGNASLSEQLIKIFGNASHNFYIDFLIDYGYLGFALLISYILLGVKNLHAHYGWNRVLICVIFLVISASRTYSFSTFLLYSLLFYGDRNIAYKS